MPMNAFAKLVSKIMKLKPPRTPQAHKKAADLYKRYASYFSGITHKKLMQKYRTHLRLAKHTR